MPPSQLDLAIAWKHFPEQIEESYVFVGHSAILHLVLGELKITSFAVSVVSLKRQV